MGAGKAASPKVFNRDVSAKVFHMEGRNVTINGETVKVLASDASGLILLATTAGTIGNLDSQGDFAKSALVIYTGAATGVAGLYENVGTAASSSFNLIGAVSAGEITLARGSVLAGNSSGVAAALDANDSGKILVGDGTDLASVAVSGDATLAANGALTVASGAITPAKLSASQALTATADGLTTGVMAATSQHAVVTSASATNAITLPASAASLIGKQFTIWVGANGFELLTPASSGATINGTDSDGTNQADIPANSLTRLTLVNTDTWIMENIGSTGTVAGAIVPDND